MLRWSGRHLLVLEDADIFLEFGFVNAVVYHVEAGQLLPECAQFVLQPHGESVLLAECVGVPPLRAVTTKIIHYHSPATASPSLLARGASLLRQCLMLFLRRGWLTSLLRYSSLENPPATFREVPLSPADSILSRSPAFLAGPDT
jgi:hypothetical protein